MYKYMYKIIQCHSIFRKLEKKKFLTSYNILGEQSFLINLVDFLQEH